MQKIEKTVEFIPFTWQQKLRHALTVIFAILGGITGTTAVSIQSCKAPPAPIIVPPPPIILPDPPTAPGPDSLKVPIDPVNAVCQIQFGNAGCSLTIVGPRLPDGRWQGVSAAHCFKGQPTQGYAKFRNGLTVRMVLQKVDEVADVAWCVTELPIEKLPYTLLAESLPKAGDRVYHCGFGVDQPGNREDGVVVNPDNGAGQTQYRISVSSGDSGGGIAFNELGHVLSPVCCTTAKGRVADVWGGTVTMCKKLRPLPSPVLDEWTPIEIPIRMPE